MKKNSADQGPHEFSSSLVPVSQLVPGDVITISSNMVLPCDCVVLAGTVVVNESNLTGESMPLQKFAVDSCDLSPLCLKKYGKKNVVFGGSNAMQSSWNGVPAVAVVLATGASSQKGRMIRGILYEEGTIKFQLYESLWVAVLISGGIAIANSIALQVYNGHPFWEMFIFNVYEAMVMLSRMLSPLVIVGFRTNQNRAAARMRQGTYKPPQLDCSA